SNGSKAFGYTLDSYGSTGLLGISFLTFVMSILITLSVSMVFPSVEAGRKFSFRTVCTDGLTVIYRPFFTPPATLGDDYHAGIAGR
ncbi:MAG: hypothetical protein FWB99_06860, partial [Treponema sp.]|nr:hypothetical protein [Treponema sp.]